MFSYQIQFAKNVLAPRNLRLCEHLLPVGTVLQKRNYLPATFQCEQAWSLRLSEDLVKKIGKPGEFYMKMLQKMRTEMKIWPLDVDLYMHSLESKTGDWHPEEVLEILKKYRRSGGVSVEVLESTQHAALRLLLSRGHTHELLTMLCQPERCGVFLDDFTAPLIMDHFLVNKDYLSSSVVATRLMLTEQLEDALTRNYALLSSLLYFKHCRQSPQVDYTYAPAEPPEKVLLRINYLVKTYVDDEMQTNDHRRLVGKTLAMCAALLPSELLRFNCSVLGWAASQHWGFLSSGLCSLAAEGGVDAFVKDEVQQLLSEAADEKLRGELEAALSALSVRPELDVLGTVEAELEQCIAVSQGQFVSNLESRYEAWAADRRQLFTEQCEAFERAQLLKSIKEKKKELKAKEELLYFFDREVEMDVLKANADVKNPFPRERPPQYRQKERTQKAKHEKYIPPSMVGGRVIKLPSD